MIPLPVPLTEALRDAILIPRHGRIYAILRRPVGCPSCATAHLLYVGAQHVESGVLFWHWICTVCAPDPDGVVALRRPLPDQPMPVRKGERPQP